MSHRVFVYLISFMCLALLGIIGVQSYWIDGAIKAKDEQFNQLIYQSLADIRKELQDYEYQQILKQFDDFPDLLQKLSEQELDLIARRQYREGGKDLYYAERIQVEGMTMPLDQVAVADQDSGTIDNIFTFTKEIALEDLAIESSQREALVVNGEDTLQIDIARNKDLAISILETFANYKWSNTPIHLRVNNAVLARIITEELASRNINAKYEYGIFSNGLATRVRSGQFKFSGNEYKTPVFPNENGRSKYDLVLSFPKKENYLISSMAPVLGLSLIFTLVIVLVFAATVYYLLRQKKISEIKNDFINNMTHEFKTPIATINLAVDAIKNPAIIKNEDKVLHYTNLIREENRRMLNQVEEVLQSARLERNQLHMKEEEIDINDLAIEAAQHNHLIIEDRGGRLDVELEALDSEVNVDKLHMGNVISNILDNANKYSMDAPQILLRTYNDAEWVYVSVRDKGMGLSKQAQKKIFDKFYRVHTGNVHTVKGHGLGLAYVKKIVELHKGTVSVQSEKGKGSTFVIQLPLRN